MIRSFARCLAALLVGAGLAALASSAWLALLGIVVALASFVGCGTALLELLSPACEATPLSVRSKAVQYALGAGLVLFGLRIDGHAGTATTLAGAAMMLLTPSAWALSDTPR
jgi:hypothetical protein